MKSKKKILTVACMCMLLAVSILGTMAYFTDSESVKNTFTVGKVGITLNEAAVNTDGTVIKGAARVTENKYHLIPGHTYIKDPVATVDAGSEDCYVRMIVEVENIQNLKDALPDDGATADYYGEDGVFLLQKLVNGWNPAVWVYEKYETEGAIGKYEFRYKEVVKKSSAATALDPLFASITVPGDYIDNDNIDELAGVKIVVNAHAIQAGGFKTAAEAWAKFPSV